MMKTAKITKILNFILFTVGFILLSPFIRPKRSREKIIGFASSHFTGNIKYLYLEMTKYPNVKLFFVSGEKDEIKRVREYGFDARYYLDLRSIPLFLKTHAWVTSHGPNYIPFIGLARRIVPFLKWKHGSKWIDVWHGIAFVHTERGNMLRDYDLAFETSEFFVNYYSGGDPTIAAKIKITGYPRNDPLLDGRWSKEEIIRKLGLPDGKNILYAPTWGHKYKKKLFPWESTEQFLDKIEKFCAKNKCNFLIRMHPNWYKQNSEDQKTLEKKTKKLPHIFHFPPDKYTDAQELLFISDVLITDWSSIANDFILLNRPIIFIETKFPVEKYVLSPEDRVGYIVKNTKEFLSKLNESIKHPNLFEDKRRKVLKKIYIYLDGNSAKRCAREIINLLSQN